MDIGLSPVPFSREAALLSPGGSVAPLPPSGKCSGQPPGQSQAWHAEAGSRKAVTDGASCAPIENLDYPEPVAFRGLGSWRGSVADFGVIVNWQLILGCK